MFVFVNYAHFNKKCRNCASSINGKQTLEKSQKSRKKLQECIIHFLTTMKSQTSYNTCGRQLGQLI